MRGYHRDVADHLEYPRLPSLRRRGADAPGRLRGLARPGGRRAGKDARRHRDPVLRDLMYLQVEHSFAFEYDTFISESFLELRLQRRRLRLHAVPRKPLAER